MIVKYSTLEEDCKIQNYEEIFTCYKRFTLKFSDLFREYQKRQVAKNRLLLKKLLKMINLKLGTLLAYDSKI